MRGQDAGRIGPFARASRRGVATRQRALDPQGTSVFALLIGLCLAAREVTRTATDDVAAVMMRIASLARLSLHLFQRRHRPQRAFT